MREQKPSSRILIADDHRLLADACKSLLEPEFQVVGIVADGRCLVQSAIELKPDNDDKGLLKWRSSSSCC